MYTSRLKLLLEMGDRVFGSGICPHDSFAKGFSCVATPCNGSFALVRDTYQRVIYTARHNHVIIERAPMTLTLSLAHPDASKDLIA